MQGGDLGLQDRIQIYNASYSHYQPCHAAAEISSRKAIIMLYFSGRVCYDLAGVRPVTTEISFGALEKSMKDGNKVFIFISFLSNKVNTK